MRANWVKIIIPTFLTFVLVFPYGGSFLHLFEDHEHKTCEINSIHFHQVDIECDVFDYYFTPKIQDSNSIFCYELIVHDELNICPRPQLYFHSLNNPYFLRGPPFHIFS